jgi:hypothetical protein
LRARLPVPPPPQSGRRAFGIVREITLLLLVAVLSAILVVTLYPRKPETDATNPPARTPPVNAVLPTKETLAGFSFSL